MAFVLDADPASATMNCYASIAEADDYMSARFGAEAWVNLDEPVKTSLLVTATNVLETFAYDGKRSVSTQPMQWPRQLIISTEGHRFPSDVLPVRMKAAMFEMALWKLQESDRPATDAELMQLKSSKVGPLDYVFKEGARTVPQIVIDLIKSISPSLLVGAPGSGIGVRTISL